MNIITITGRVGQDAELRQTPQGRHVANFKVVVDVGFGDKKHALWIDCSMFGQRAEKVAKYITKGTPVTVYGQFDLRTYTTKNGPGASITCDVADIALQGGKRGEDAAEPVAGPKAPAMRPSEWEDDGDILPF
jgi:single-strand DNA-binding protein